MLKIYSKNLLISTLINFTCSDSLLSLHYATIEYAYIILPYNVKYNSIMILYYLYYMTI